MKALPKLPDTSGVEVPEEFRGLVDALAQGPIGARGTARSRAAAVVRTILALGYRLEVRAPSVDVLTLPAWPESAQFGAGDDGLVDLAGLLGVWEVARVREHVAVELLRALGDHALKIGEPLVAYDILREALVRYPDDVRLRQLAALALARSGAPDRAAIVLDELVSEGNIDEETLALRARTLKDVWASAIGTVRRDELARATHDAYRRSYRSTGGYYSGINAATMAALLGRRRGARVTAREVRDACSRRLRRTPKSSDERYWVEATLGEASLILGDFGEAERWYGRAASHARSRVADLSTTRHQARLLAEALYGERGRFDHCFPVPRIAVCAGHMIDADDRKVPRFPPEAETRVAGVIRAELDRIDARIGYASGANGTDILFLEAMLDRGGEIHMVLPYDVAEFRRASVDRAGTDWGERFDRLLARAARVTNASGQRNAEPGGVTYEYANLLLDGLATLRGQMLDTEVHAIAVWDGKPGDALGGTASFVEHLRAHGRSVDIVDVDARALTATPGAGRVRRTPSTRTRRGVYPQRIAAIMFADVVSYSKLTEEEIPNFIRHFMAGIAERIAASAHKPVARNTWGDGIFLVFESVESAFELAMDLRDYVRATPWTELGLPETINLRIGLHAGPVFKIVDPIMGRVNFTGSHVSRTARIEPITPPGHVYASQAFAAVAAARAVPDFACEYVGVVPLAKQYGAFPTYHIRRTTENVSGRP